MIDQNSIGSAEMPMRKGDMLEVNQACDGSEFEMGVGEILGLRLSENPTTGYRWQVQSPGSPVLVPVEESYEAAREGFGAGGVRRWVFRSVQAGIAHLEMERQRSWERRAVETFKVTIRVQAR
jgi:inhibitor of cysteine peptidase